MRSSDLKKYIENPNLLDKQSVGELEKLVQEFPYFQSAHILLSMASKKWDTSVYQKSLKKTAIVVSNRAHLFGLVHKYEAIDENSSFNNEKSSAKEELKTEIRQNKEDIRQELDILKAAEVSTISIVEMDNSTSKLNPEEILEKEIEKQVVTSFVEKEILKTNTAHLVLPQAKEPNSFTGWLAYLKNDTSRPVNPSSGIVKITLPEQKYEDKREIPANEELQKRKQKNKALIDKIIESNPGHIRTKEEQKFYTPDTTAKESLLDNEHLVTETLAKIYGLQGNVNKAVRAYQILSLKYPQKSAYFASLIQKLKHNQ